MLISYNWIKSFTSYKEELQSLEIRNLFSWHACEIDEVISESQNFQDMVVGKINKISKHPNADTLFLCQTDLGAHGIQQIVCGGTNLTKNQLVAVAMPKAHVKWHGEGDLIQLTKTKIRGEESFGMICAAEEMGLGHSSDNNILDLSHLKSPAGTPLAKALGKNDFILDIDNKTLTNRPDLWSAEGLARELATITNTKFTPLKTPKVSIPKKGETTQLKVESQNFVKRFQTLIIENLEVQDSPQEVQDLLKKSGLTPKNNIVDASNYVMYELGQPMHTYDYHKISNNGSVEFRIHNAKQNQSMELLGEETIQLETFDHILSAKQESQILLGIKGGKGSGINSDTNKIVLEAAVFDGLKVRKSSSYHHVRTDSSARYEKQLDPEQTQRAILRFVEVLQISCPKLQISGPLTDFYPEKFQASTIELPLNKVDSYLGIPLEKKNIIQILNNLGFQVKDKKDKLLVTVPSFRSTGDIEIYQDLIEEIARHYGYHKLEAKLKPYHGKPGNNLQQRVLEHTVRKTLSSFGMNEVLNYNFINQDDINHTHLNASNHLQLLNTLNQEHTHMRQTLLSNLLKSLEFNHKNFPQIQFFEIGRTHTEIGEYFPAEEEKLSLIVSGHKDNFLILKGYLQALFTSLNLNGLKFQASHETSPYFHPNMSGQYLYQGKNLLAEIGIIHPMTQKNYNLQDKEPIAYAEINLGMLHKYKPRINQFTAINSYPSLEFDLSVVVESTTYNMEVEQVLKKSSNLINSIQLFDIYQGQNLEANQKALTYKIQLQALDRTLESKDLEQVQQSCYKNLEKIGAMVRGS